VGEDQAGKGDGVAGVAVVIGIESGNMTAILRPTLGCEPAALISAPANVLQRFVLRNISWETYEALLADLAEEHVFLTYDEGTLEFMSPLPKHERDGHLLSRLIQAFTEVLDIPIAGFGRTTWRSKASKKGLEADECFYIRTELQVRGREDIELPKDPPPDLAIEVDLTRNTIDKERVYAGLKIGELWRYEDERLIVRTLQPDGQYIEVNESPNLPKLPLLEVQRFMKLRHGAGETAWIRGFRKWVEERFHA
jgi:Uma2 family endonuclease